MNVIRTVAELQRTCRRYRRKLDARVEPVDLRELDKWYLAEDGVFRHETGRFFQIVGVEADPDIVTTGPTIQPMLKQTDVGVLCLFETTLEGESHGLIVFKFEPGSPYGIEVAPSFQATRSNYEGAHGGLRVPGVDIALCDERSTSIDALQREQEAWFLGKVNRNRVARVAPRSATEVSLGIPHSYWVPMRVLKGALLVDHLINMDLRSILSMVFFSAEAGNPLWQRPDVSKGSEDVLPFAGSHQQRSERSLANLTGWKVGRELANVEAQGATVVGRRVTVSSREVTSWEQPLLAPERTSECVLVVRQGGSSGGWEVGLVRRVRIGSVRGPSYEPTIQRHDDVERLSGKTLSEVLQTMKQVSSRSVSVTHAEEGGRFYRARTRYTLLVIDETRSDIAHRLIDGLEWFRLSEIGALVSAGDLLSVEARTCIGMFRAWVDEDEGEPA